MLLHTGRLLSFRSTYVGITNCLHGRPTDLRTGLHYSGSYRSFHARPTLRQRPSTQQADRPFLDKYKKSIEFPPATHDIETLLAQAAPGQEVTLHGYLGQRTDLSKNLSFVRLTDPTMRHNIQLVSSTENGMSQKIKTVNANSPVVVRGKVQTKRGGGPDAPKSECWEILVENIHSLNDFPKDIIMTPETVFPPEQRYLQLRSNDALRDALQFRAEVRNICKDELEQSQPPFMEVETPLLFKSTPEGAREFVVPTRKQGLAYALPQSPQQYKQLLMASGIPKYYQFARCFRDEDLRADRQPEFTQLDLEISFATSEDVIRAMEGVIRRLWSSLMKDPVPSGPFKRLTYQEAMSRYGSDKPDTRIGMEIIRINSIIESSDLISKITYEKDPFVDAFKFENIDNDPAAMMKFVNDYLDSPAGRPFMDNPDGGPGVFYFDAKKPLCGLQPFGFEAADQIEKLLDLDHGDAVVIQARKKLPYTGGSTAIGDFRCALHNQAVSLGFRDPTTGSDFLWITDFPLFSPVSESEPGQGGAAGIRSTHHPFTAPKTAADVDALLSDPTAAVADHFDLVINGVEVGGGSRRIHDAAVQEFILRDILQMSEPRLADFDHLLSALRAGCPPHAGMALGLDRLVALMLGKESVRDVIAFPKSGKGEDATVKAPGPLTEEALELYHLRMRG